MLYCHKITHTQCSTSTAVYIKVPILVIKVGGMFHFSHFVCHERGLYPFSQQCNSIPFRSSRNRFHKQTTIFITLTCKQNLEILDYSNCIEHLKNKHTLLNSGSTLVSSSSTASFSSNNKPTNFGAELRNRKLFKWRLKHDQFI